MVLGARTDRKEWESCAAPVRGVYIGWRTYANGTIQYEFEDGYSFSATEHFKIALIVTDERQNPVPVMFDEMVEL